MKTTLSINFLYAFKTSCILLVVLLLPFNAFSQIEQGLYTIKLASAGTMLDAELPNMDKDECKVQTWAYLGGANQHWKIVPSSRAGAFNIKVAGSGRSLDAASNERATNGGRIILWNQNDGPSQQWSIERISGNRYRIRLLVSSKLLSGTGNVNGSKVQLWDDLRNSTQEWIIEKVKRVTISDKYVDLRPNQTSIQHQGSRGTCTTFGATAALEAAYKKAGYGNVNLSEEFFAMQGKALYLHPHWRDTERRGADSAENQLSGTQGGGTLHIFRNGFAIPDSSYVPYRSTDYRWDTVRRDGNKPLPQKSVNNFNFSLNNDRVLKAPRYYSAKIVGRLSDPKNAAEYEQLLQRGQEIHFAVRFIASDGHADKIWRPSCNPDTDTTCRPGAHNMLIVGYDKTHPDPANHYFIVKNSWGHSRIPGSDGFNYMHYEYLKYVSDAEYVRAVHPPKKWPELSLLGEYSLNFDGWKGRLDIYHLPGVAQWIFENNGVAVADRRLGIFYDQSGRAFRVNGSVRRINDELLEITFFINNAHPNPRWDELAGRKFIYYYDVRNNFMAGFHTDPGGTARYAGYAIKARNTFVNNSVRTPRPFNAASYINSNWTINISNGPKGNLYIYKTDSGLSGKFYDSATRAKSDVEITVSDNSFDKINFKFRGISLRGQHLSWEEGLIAGFDLNSKKPFHMVRQAPHPQTPKLTKTILDKH